MKVFRSEALKGKITMPGDKSISHRAILLTALANGKSRIQNILVAGVTEKMLSALTELGVVWQLTGNELNVTGKGLTGLKTPSRPLDCGNSATTMRMLAGVCSAAGISAVLDGSQGLRARPMARIIEPLSKMGVIIRAQNEGRTAPLQILARQKGQSLRGVDYSSPVASAQVKSCILLAGLAADGVINYKEPSASRDHTERMLSGMGVEINRKEQRDGSVLVTMEPQIGKTLHPLHTAIPGDISSAAFLIVAGLITPGSEITIQNVGLNPTRTGLLEVLMEMGAALSIKKRSELNGEPVGEITVRHSRLRGIQLSTPLVVKMIDEIPIFTVAAAYAEGETRVNDAEELRVKETDRITALRRELKTLGVDIKERDDGFSLQGGTPLQGGIIQPHGDHRMAMALAVAGLAAEGPVEIQNSRIVAESYPNFVPALTSLGARVEQ